MKLKIVCLMLAIASGVQGFLLAEKTKDWSAQEAGFAGAITGAVVGGAWSIGDYLSLKKQEQKLEAQIAGNEPSDKSFEELHRELKLVRHQKSRVWRYLRQILIGMLLGGGVGSLGQHVRKQRAAEAKRKAKEFEEAERKAKEFEEAEKEAKRKAKEFEEAEKEAKRKAKEFEEAERKAKEAARLEAARLEAVMLAKDREELLEKKKTILALPPNVLYFCEKAADLFVKHVPQQIISDDAFTRALCYADKKPDSCVNETKQNLPMAQRVKFLAPPKESSIDRLAQLHECMRDIYLDVDKKTNDVVRFILWLNTLASSSDDGLIEAKKILCLHPSSIMSSVRKHNRAHNYTIASLLNAVMSPNGMCVRDTFGFHLSIFAGLHKVSLPNPGLSHEIS